MLGSTHGEFAQGIGDGLRDAGARVFICDVNADTAAGTAERLGREFVVADVTDSKAVEAAFDRVVSEAGSLDVAVNNAGIVHNHPSETLSDEDWRRQHHQHRQHERARVVCASIPFLPAM